MKLVLYLEAALLCTSIPLPGFGQESRPDKTPAFEVASIRPAGNRGPDWGINDLMNKGPVRDPTLLSVRNRTLRTLVRWAYGVDYYRVSGGPAWVDTAGFDVEAHPPGPSTPAEMMAMLRTLLADRFQLRIHHQMSPILVNVLTVARDGPKFGPQFHDVKGGEQAATPAKPIPDQVPFRNMSMKVFVNYLRLNLTRDRVNPSRLNFEDVPPVVDETGLSGDYDIILNTAGEDDWPAILERQLGLKLDLKKIPMDVIVIDGAAQPLAN